MTIERNSERSSSLRSATIQKTRNNFYMEHPRFLVMNQSDQMLKEKKPFWIDLKNKLVRFSLSVKSKQSTHPWEPNSQIKSLNMIKIVEFKTIPTTSADATWPSFRVLTIFFTSSLVPFCTRGSNRKKHVKHQNSQGGNPVDQQIKKE